LIYVLICRGCRKLRVYRGSNYCAACLADMAKGWPEA